VTVEAVIDKKGRVVVPRHLRERLKLHEGAKVRLTLEEGKIVIMKPMTPEEFIKEMEGCIKENSPVPKVNPLRLKKIWERI
jgi:AbrB family looped-hinge helix DNA binding protein